MGFEVHEQEQEVMYLWEAGGSLCATYKESMKVVIISSDDGFQTRKISLFLFFVRLAR